MCGIARDRSADVSVFRGGTLRATVQVESDADATREPLESRRLRVGLANVWDVTAADVLKLQLDLHRSSAVLKLKASNAKECGQCAKSMPPVNPPIIPGPPPVVSTKPRRAVVEIIDHETLRRNGVLMKKKYLPIGYRKTYTRGLRPTRQRKRFRWISPKK